MAGKPLLAQSERYPLHRGVLPLEGELLSSYLLRVALAHSADHYRFYSSLIPKAQVWSRDIDLNPPERMISLLTDRCGLTGEAVESMTLRPYANAISGKMPGRSGTAEKWINMLGVYHRTRIKAGLQVCPQCLLENLAYMRIWRLSFVTWCPVHARPLVAVCPGCNAPIVPHRQVPGTSACHNCHVDHLVRAGQAKDEQGIAPLAQASMLSALDGGGLISTAEGTVTLSDLSRGICLLRRWKMFRVPECVRGRAIELQGYVRRQVYFDVVHELIRDWPATVGQLVIKGNISKSTFEDSSPPPWLACVGERLGNARRSRLFLRNKASLSTWLSELSSEKPPGWRAKRAKALARAALKK